MEFVDKSNGEPVECPYCGKRTVVGKIIVKYYYQSEHGVFTDGIEMSGETVGRIIGEPMMCSPTIELASCYCSSCNEKIFSYNYKLEKDENGLFGFVKVKNDKKL